jgi:vancomycin permeability regulator SanA
VLGWCIADRPPSAPGCFVVPSYALRDTTTPTRPTRSQIELAADWWRRFPEAMIIMSTGDNQRLGVSNATVMAAYAVRLGVPQNRVIEEDQSRNTLENLVNCRQIIDDRSLRQPTLVTFDLYTRRAVAVARRLGWRDCFWLSATAPGEPAAGWKRWQTRSRTSILCYEVAATVYCRLAGWI